VANEVIAVASLLAGAVMGLGSSLVISSIRQRQEISLRLLDQYLSVRNEVVDAVSDLTHLDNHEAFDTQARESHEEKIGKLFYKHYDFLPTQVLDALLLLHVALANSQGELFVLRDNAISELRQADIPAFINECCMYKNAAFVAALALKSKNPTVRCNQSIKLHARHVLYTLNRFASLDEIRTMTTRFRKVALL